MIEVDLPVDAVVLALFASDRFEPPPHEAATAAISSKITGRVYVGAVNMCTRR
ncbi:MAG: hypothetical protein H7123_06670 [Thermoleophilia bacterium]|nr:hypothetical protein [Thermoleophilia bacterium]